MISYRAQELIGDDENVIFVDVNIVTVYPVNININPYRINKFYNVELFLSL